MLDKTVSIRRPWNTTSAHNCLTSNFSWIRTSFNGFIWSTACSWAALPGSPCGHKVENTYSLALKFFADLNTALYYQISGVLSHFWNLYQMFSFQSGLSFPGWWQWARELVVKTQLSSLLTCIFQGSWEFVSKNFCQRYTIESPCLWGDS